jgi:tRNA(fMet)-specific endonuclease VapC
MIYLLDTNVCISYLNNPESQIRERLQKLVPSSVVLCATVEAELFMEL